MIYLDLIKIVNQKFDFKYQIRTQRNFFLYTFFLVINKLKKI